MNNARLVRRAFIPRPGYIFMCIDYDQIEMRLFAHDSNCERLIENINNGFDPHLGTALDIFGKKIVYFNNEVRKLTRRGSKDINFGFIYGMGIRKLKAQLTLQIRNIKEKIKTKKIDIPTPDEIFQEYHKKYPVKEYMRRVTGEIYRNGLTRIEYHSKLMNFIRDYRVPQDLAYRGANLRIQGTAAYVMKYGMKRACEFIDEFGLDVHLLGTIHDELIFEVPDEKENIRDIIRDLKEQMEDRVTFKVPILASAKTSDKSWGDIK